MGFRILDLGFSKKKKENLCVFCVINSVIGHWSQVISQKNKTTNKESFQICAHLHPIIGCGVGILDSHRLTSEFFVSFSKSFGNNSGDLFTG